MTSDAEEAPFAHALLIPLGVLALYVLSMGPVWRATTSSGTANWFFKAYSPIIWTADRCDPVDNALDWYLALWGPPLSLR
jgi:hypothetical protein